MGSAGRLDCRGFHSCLRGVSRLRRFAFVCLTTVVWFLASQHCTLEAAGFLAHHEDAESGCCGKSAEQCHADACLIVETPAYRTADAEALVAAPLEDFCSCVPCLLPEDGSRDFGLEVEYVRETEAIRPWVPLWRFEQRAVAPPGAPSSLAA